jgi:predicted transcriptional regulator
MLKRTNLYLDTSDMTKLATIAKRQDRKTAYLVRKAIREYLDRNLKRKQ